MNVSERPNFNLKKFMITVWMLIVCMSLTGAYFLYLEFYSLGAIHLLTVLYVAPFCFKKMIEPLSKGTILLFLWLVGLSLVSLIFLLQNEITISRPEVKVHLINFIISVIALGIMLHLKKQVPQAN